MKKLHYYVFSKLLDSTQVGTKLVLVRTTKNLWSGNHGMIGDGLNRISDVKRSNALDG